MAEMMRPGRQFFVCALTSKKFGPVFYLHKVIVGKREEDVPVIEKLLKVARKESRLEFHHSVFKDWIQDDEGTFD